jgi:hypothetical protein
MPNQSVANQTGPVQRILLARMTEEEKPIPFGEKGSPPPDPQCEPRGSREAVGGFPNQNVCDGHCCVGLKSFDTLPVLQRAFA